MAKFRNAIVCAGQLIQKIATSEHKKCCIATQAGTFDKSIDPVVNGKITYLPTGRAQKICRSNVLHCLKQKKLNNQGHKNGQFQNFYIQNLN